MFNRRRVKPDEFGKLPDVEYFQGDMDYIKSYHEHMRASYPELFAIDDITWKDLDMERVFRRINRGATTSGEQVLYHLLRTPALDEAEWTRRHDLITLMEDDTLRRRTAGILGGLGALRRANPCLTFAPEPGRGRLALCVTLALLLPLSFAVPILLGESGALAVLGVVIINSLTHEIMKRRLVGELDAVNYMVSLTRVMGRFRHFGDERLEPHLAPAHAPYGRLKQVLRIGFAMPAEAGDTLLDLMLTVTLLDLIAFDRLKHTFLRRHEDVLVLHDVLGRLDAAISVASFRRTLPCWIKPEINFAPDALHAVEAEEVVHPLLAHPVPNDLRVVRPLLITGSNASGKSTFLKTSALCVLLAQAVCTAPARSYRGPACLLFTSMTLSDDLIAGESYYIAEMRAIKRILDALATGKPVLCAIDEVLRGTNTIERIAASCEILLALQRAGALCLVATHDVELCALLEPHYANMHFEERIEEGKMLFDYRLRPGGAITRNAINLLALIGLDKSIIDAAHARARRYLETGLWS